MPKRSFADRLRAFFDPRPARWRTVIVFAVVLAYADGYVLEVVTGAVGAIQRTSHPFVSWMEQSAILIPFFLLAELVVLWFVRRRKGPVFRSTRAMLVSALLLAIGGTVVGLAAVTASATYDYRLQTNLIDFQQGISPETGVPLIPAGSTFNRGNCNSMICDEERFSLAADIRGVAISVPLLLGGNIVLTAWMLACFGGRLGAPIRRTATAGPAAGSATDSAAVAITAPATELASESTGAAAPAPSGEPV